ncbi:MAG: protein TolQ [Holosporaceae bacterium]|jgi:biopolymer transport protein TolQ|nr:protein TolQ [Holosporaceae bacterium]
MNGVDEVVTTVTEVANHDLSLLGLFSQASFTVKLVILLLIGCSFWSWSIIFAKFSFIRNLKARADRFEESFWNAVSLDTFYDGVNPKEDDPFVSVFIAGMKELRRTKAKVKSVIGGISLRDRVDRLMRVAVGREMVYLEQHLGFLATVGATAPFVGLFGTVWGIMNSFESIGFSQNTSLTAVAPGIAEALFATALGLVVTIPAVIGYNKISSEINKYQGRLEAFIDEFSAVISRQIEDSEV